jgi:hypothetical protein
MSTESPSAPVPAASPGDPSVMAPQPERPEQGKFSIEETNFLKTRLPAYGALCQQLREKSTGPRGTGSVKGCKKDWILSEVFPEFVKQFACDQNGGPQLQSLQTVSFVLWHIVGAKMGVEIIAMVLESLIFPKSWLRCINYRHFQNHFCASACHQRCFHFCR